MLDGRIEDTHWSSRSGDFTWGKGSNFKDTKEILGKGIAPNQKCLDIFEELKDVVNAKLGLAVPVERCRSARRKRRPAWAGGSINMARYNEMQTTGKVIPCFTGLTRRADRPIVRIGLNTSMSCGNQPEDFGRISAVAGVLCEKLESLGYGVEIYAVDSCRPYGMSNRKYDAMGHRKTKGWGEYWMNTKWLIKNGDEPLDCQRIMSHGMSGLLRCWGFSACYLMHGACDPSSMSCLDTPREVIESCGLDIMVEKSWSRTNSEANADRIVGMVEELVGTPSSV
jgi:hypothetical protein